MRNLLDDLIIAEKEKYLNARANYEKLNYLNNYIELKIQSQTYKNDPTIYGDIKEFLNLYVSSTEEKIYGYYEINKDKILKKIELVSPTEQISMLSYFERILKLNGLESNYKWVNKELRKKKINFYKTSLSINNFFSLISHIATYTTFTLIGSILLLYLFYSIVLLPAPNESWVLFNFEIKKYSDNQVSNHLLNTLMSFCNFGEIEFEKLHPRNWRGVFLDVLIKLSLFILVLGFLVEELKKRVI